MLKGHSYVMKGGHFVHFAMHAAYSQTPTEDHTFTYSAMHAACSQTAAEDHTSPYSVNCTSDLHLYLTCIWTILLV